MSHGGTGFYLQQFSSVLPLTPAVEPITFRQYGNGTNNDANLAATEAAGLYNLILGRPTAPTENTTVANAILAGTSTAQVAGGLFSSVEYETETVASYYQNFLGRVGSSSEVAGWVSLLQSGATEEQVASAFFASTEFNAAHTDPAGFVGALYNDLLGRQGASAEVDYWVGQMASGTSRSSVVASFLASTEFETRTITGDYMNFLARLPIASEVDYWLPMLADNGGSLTEAELAAEIAGSVEFQNRASAVLR